MTQLNIHMTPVFEKNLKYLMKIRGFHTKSEAIRIVIKEAIELSTHKTNVTDFSTWAGLAKQVPTNSKPRFKSDNDLWK